ncbi:hypothetical protein RvY_13415 [Ramazzottius varieornatus]|uniref:Uncharacterized protein n=1 Tax=Ramazzottius varieornatus TaxID=947166 RepID=A0A1D1VMR6_RAMVA|nr:hypothetical protein RvY_13415 [Ramazzottius varieornatus]
MGELVANLCKPIEQYKLRNQERLTNRQRDQQGSAVSELLRDPDPMPPHPLRSKSLTKPVKNYALQNRQLLRQLAVAQKEKTLAQQIPSLLKVSSRYENVESRVFRETESNLAEKKPLRTEYLRAHSKTGPNSDISLRPRSNISPSRSCVSQSSVPSRYSPNRLHSASTTASSCTLTSSREPRNYIKLNGQVAKEPKQIVGNRSFTERQTGFLQKLEKLPKTPLGQVPL